MDQEPSLVKALYMSGFQKAVTNPIDEHKIKDKLFFKYILTSQVLTILLGRC